MRNRSQAYIFRKAVPYSQSGYIEKALTSHGEVTKVKARFASGEAGTLHVRPVVILNGEIEIDLFEYADGGLQYINGDDEIVESDVRYEIENKAKLRVYYENTSTDALSADSMLNVDIGVTYYQVIEEENVIGPRSNRRGLF